jgi:hypothetical protein
MSISTNLGVEASHQEVEIIDTIIGEYLTQKKWPKNRFNFSRIENLLQKKCLCVCNDHSICVLISGVVVSSWWPALIPYFNNYWREILRMARVSRDRAAIVEINIDKWEDENQMPIFLECVKRHYWFGDNLSYDGSGKVSLTIPSFVRRCISFSQFEQIFESIQEISHQYSQVSALPNTISRSPLEIRSTLLKSFGILIEQTLSNNLVIPQLCPKWLGTIIIDYMTEADNSLRSGSYFSASVLYGAAIESILAIRYSSPALPPNSPDELAPNVLFQIFKINNLLASARLDPHIPAALLNELEFCRKCRNGIHANQYSTGLESITLLDSLKIRGTVKNVLLFIDQ